MVRSDSRGYPILDLSSVIDVKRCVVRCYHKSDARNFLSAIMEQFPEMSRHWDFPDNRIENMWSDDGGHFDFFPEFEFTDGTLGWDTSDYADEEDYNIVEFDKIPTTGTVDDLGIIVVADESLDDLLT